LSVDASKKKKKVGTLALENPYTAAYDLCTSSKFAVERCVFFGQTVCIPSFWSQCTLAELNTVISLLKSVYVFFCCFEYPKDHQSMAQTEADCMFARG